MNKKYNIGLDIGTNSVGWAVVEADTQKIIKKGTKSKRKALWGVRLFDSAVTAQERRMFRSTRRRYDRRRQRIKLLQEEFQNEINLVDAHFYQKLKESKFHELDSVNKSILLSSEEKHQIRKYYRQYPTIYHLRDDLITNSSKKDIRLVYLAIHHIIKYRGNFLYAGDSFNVDDLDLNSKLHQLFDLLVEMIPELNFPEDWLNVMDLDDLSTIIMNPLKSDMKVHVKNYFKDYPDCRVFSQEFGKLLAGNKFSIKKLLMLEDLEQDITISFNDTSYDEKYAELEATLVEKMEILDILKNIFDTLFLKKLFKGSKNINLSSLMVEKYNQHAADLRFLKTLLSTDRHIYNRVFRTQGNLCLYEQYLHNQKSYDDFIRELQKYLVQVFEQGIDNDLRNQYELDVQPRMLSGDFLPRITTPMNGQFPYQLNKEELIKIIENQGKYYPFLLEKVNGKYKLVQLLEFRIPYYVGPLVSDKQSPFAWMERKLEHVKITPYNFNDVIDKEGTAEKFIKRMISHCTYLLREYALPNNSILYSKFKVMNELKQIRVNGEKLSRDQQHEIYDKLFLNTNGSITEKKLQQFLNSLDDFKMYQGDFHITGFSSDGKFANTMQSYYDFFGENGIFKGTTYQEDDADSIIEWVTIFDDKDILEQKVKTNYPELNENQIKAILGKKYSGWGSLSKKLLTDFYTKDVKSGNSLNIMDLLYETDENFMQILNNDDYQFQKMIQEYNQIENISKVNYNLVKDLATSPATKKGIYQSLLVVQELIDYMGYAPENIMIEMAREKDNKKERTLDRKKYLTNLYEKFYDSIFNYHQLYEELQDQEKIASQKLYLYFIQEGKCLYSGKPLNIEDLDSYEIDHILPRTLIKDDSIDNKALVYRECNQVKKDNYVLPREYRTHSNIEWWKHLRSIGLMSAKKFYNLTRQEFKDEDIQGFINRQLVETRQITKHVANIISNLYPNTNVVYLKANLSHDYRDRYDLFKFRDINDYHHAHDAYLAAVLGEYKEKYLKKNVNFDMVQELNHRIYQLGDYGKLKYGYVINSLDEQVSDIINNLSKNFVDEKTGEILFDARHFNCIVANTLYRNDILVSRKTEIRSGQFFKQTIYSKDKANVPLKKNMPVEIYGGYSNVETSYMVLVSYENKKKIIGIPLEVASKSKKDYQIKLDYIQKHLNLKNSDFKILKDYIPFETLICYEKQNVYIKGYSIANKNNELSNAMQLKIPKEKMKVWKYVLQEILNHKILSTDILSEENKNAIAKEIVQFLFEQKENYPLFQNAVLNIENRISFEDMNFEEISKLIIELFKIYQCNSTNANLSSFGLGDRIGRLSGRNINSGIIKFQSVTGLKEVVYEFSNCSDYEAVTN